MITAAHVEQYRAEGCTHVADAFGDWVGPLTAAVDRVLAAFAGGAPPPLIADARTQNPPTLHRTGTGGIQLRNCLMADAAFVDWLRASPAAALVGALTGATATRFWMDATFVKTGSDPQAATPWHNDGCTFAFAGEQLPSLWIALTDVAEDNAPLLTLAGSNRDAFRYHSPLSRQDVTLPGTRPWSDLEARVAAPEADIRVWPVAAGDMLLIHPRTIHASRPRTATATGRRVAFTTRWIGSDAVWAPDALSASIPKLSENPSMVVGEAPPEAVFPVLWRAE